MTCNVDFLLENEILLFRLDNYSHNKKQLVQIVVFLCECYVPLKKKSCLVACTQQKKNTGRDLSEIQERSTCFIATLK